MVFSSSSKHPSSTTAYPHVNKLLDSLHLLDSSSHSYTFTLPTSTTHISPQTTPTIVPALPPISPLLPSSSVSSDALPLLPQDAVATSSHLQQFSAVRQLTGDLHKTKSRHPKRPQPSPGEAGTPSREWFTMLFVNRNTLNIMTR